VASSTTVLDKRKLIREHAAGKSYIDIGGLWGTKGETVTTAIAGGASRATMADFQPLGNEWWERFDAYAAEQGVTEYGRQQIDICRPEAPAALGTYDIVHCAGLMYHVPDLFSFIGNLCAVANEYLLLSSVVMPDVVSNEKGTIEFGPDVSYLTPVLSDANREIVLEFLRSNSIHASGLTNDEPFFEGTRAKTGPWWWLFSGEFMARVVAMHGLEILAEGRTRGGNGYTVFAKVGSAGA
jgi:hypothetical protein